MAERELSDEEAASLGLVERELDDNEAAKLGLPPQQSIASEVPLSGNPSKGGWIDTGVRGPVWHDDIDAETQRRERFDAQQLGGSGMFGWGGEINGAIDATADLIREPGQKWTDSYRAHRDEFDARRERAKERQPEAFAGGETQAASMEAMGTGLITGGGLIRNMSIAAGLGGFQAAGESEADATRGEFGKLANDTQSGAEDAAGMAFLLGVAPDAVRRGVKATAGKVVDPLIEWLKNPANKASQYVKDRLRDMAEKAAFKSTGAMLSDYRNAERYGSVNEIGGELLDRKVVTPLASLKDIKNRSEALVNEAGENMDKSLRSIDRAARPGERFNPNRAADKIESELVGPMHGRPAEGANIAPVQHEANEIRKVGARLAAEDAKRVAWEALQSGEVKPNDAATNSIMAKIDGILSGDRIDPATMGDELVQLGLSLDGRNSSFPSTGRALIEYGHSLKATGFPETSLSHAERNIKRPYDKRVNFNKDQPEKQEYLKRVRGLLNSEIENQAMATAPQPAAEFMAAKKQFGNMLPIMESAEDQILRKQANRQVSPTDYAVGLASAAGGIASGNPMAGAAATGALASAGHKVARERGSTLWATGLNAGSKGAGWTGKQATSLADRLAQDPGSFGRWADQFHKELQMRGPAGVAVLHYVLSGQDPEYQRLQSDESP